MRILSIIIITFLFSFPVLGEGYLDKKIGIQFPEKMGAFEYGRYKKFDDDKLGYGISYGSEKAKITLYVFNAGASEIKDGVKDAWVRLCADKAVEDVFFYEKRQLYRKVKEVSLPKEIKKPVRDFYISKALRYERKKEDGYVASRSYLFCRGVNGEILKIRATGDASELFEKDLNEFLMELKKRVESAKKE